MLDMLTAIDQSGSGTTQSGGLTTQESRGSQQPQVASSSNRRNFATNEDDELMLHTYGIDNTEGLELATHHPMPAHALKNMKISIGFFTLMACVSFIFFVAASPSRYWSEHTISSSTGSTLFVHHGLIEFCYSGVAVDDKCVDITADCQATIEGVQEYELPNCGRFTTVRVMHLLSGCFVFIGAATALVSNYWFDDHRPYHAFIVAIVVCWLGCFCEMLAIAIFADDAGGTSSLKWGFALASLSFVSSLLAPIVLLVQVVWERCTNGRRLTAEEKRQRQVDIDRALAENQVVPSGMRM